MYKVTLGFEHDVIPAALARAQWDLTPEGMRSGEREGAFILWSPDANGWRGKPVVFRPLPASEAEEAAA